MFFCKQCRHTYSIAKQIQGKEDTGYFHCTNCEHVEKIADGTVIHQSVLCAQTADADFPDPMMAPHYPFQRKRIPVCPNKKCPSKGKPVEVAIVRDGNFNVCYVCVLCHHQTPQGHSLKKISQSSHNGR